jgi:hypothetical protein
VRPFGARTKKLIVAFHFLRANPAAWKCDTCRKSGLEISRRCGWVPAAKRAASHVVWARGRISTDECPKSLITAQSIGWVEEFLVWKRLHLSLPFDVNVRHAEAFLILEEQLDLEKQSGTESLE